MNDSNTCLRKYRSTMHTGITAIVAAFAVTAVSGAVTAIAVTVPVPRMTVRMRIILHLRTMHTGSGAVHSRLCQHAAQRRKRQGKDEQGQHEIVRTSIHTSQTRRLFM